MLFSSGIGISLLYFGASEPLDHYFNPPEGVSGSHEAARQALQLTFLHWGLHGSVGAALPCRSVRMASISSLGSSRGVW